RIHRELSIERLFGLADPPPVRSLYHYEGLKGKIDVPSESITMILSRDVRANVRIGAEMALTIARENPQRDVWYVNTYAGIALMKDAFREALANASMPEPAPDYTTGPKPDAEPEVEEAPLTNKDAFYPGWRPPGPRAERPWEQWEQSSGGAWTLLNKEESKRVEEEFLAKRDAERASARAALDAAKAAALALLPQPVLPNLHLFDVPLGQWDAEKLSSAINTPQRALRCEETHHPVLSPQGERETVEENPVVIINSFEYAPLNRNGKWRMAREILELQESLSLTVILFSHEMRSDLESGLPGRGSLGLISGQAASVVRLADPFEHLIRSRKPRNQPERATIHEAQMLAPGFCDDQNISEEGQEIDVIAMSAEREEAIPRTKSIGLRTRDRAVGLRPARNDTH
ncbi:MAG: hypothetical protein Q8902_10130, partial [Bacteroidota bacterium]|nr:hypothetical protein [Bacteroidota bacterium]